MNPTGDAPVGFPRVLHVLEAVRGGTSRHVLDVVRHTPGIDHMVAVALPGGDGGSGAAYDSDALEAMTAAGAQVVGMSMRRTPWQPANAAAVSRLRRLLVSSSVQVVHGHSSVGGALARLAAVGTGIPAVYTANGLAGGRPYLTVERALGRLTDRWIAVSTSEARLAEIRGVARPGRLTVIPNGIDLEASPPGEDLRQRLGLDADTPLVGTVARLVAQKAPERFARVAAEVATRLPDPHFLLIGMGPRQRLVDEEVERADLGSRWHQIDHHPDAASVLGQLDVFALVSDFEGAPYTPLEAMRAGVPVVLSDVVGNCDAVKDRISGFLRPPSDIPGLAADIGALLTDEDLRRRLVGNARERLRRHFDVAVMGRKLADLYLELANANTGSDAGGRHRRRTRRLPQPSESSSTHSPDSSAAQ